MIYVYIGLFIVTFKKNVTENKERLIKKSLTEKLKERTSYYNYTIRIG